MSYNSGVSENRIKKIVTHLRPHSDELVALMLLRKFPEGEEKFPGIRNAEISFLSTGELKDGKTAEDFSDTVFLGCGGGIFDEHATSKKEREDGETCVTLVAKYLELEKDPALAKILFFIKEEDLKGSKVKNELPMVIKFLHTKYPDRYEDIYNWTEKAYFAEYLEEKKSPTDEKDWQRPTLENIYALLKKQNDNGADEWKKFADEAISYQFQRFDEAKKEFSLKGKMEKIFGADGKMIQVASVVSDNEEMNKYARSIGAHIVIQFSSRGNVAILTDRKRKLDLTYAFVLLRMAEQHYRGGLKIKDEKELSKEGFVDGIPFWYLFHTRDMGFNGSSTTSDVEPTKIPHDKVVELVKEGVK